MRTLEIILNRWLDYEPPGLCHTGIEELAGLGAAGAAGAAETATTALALPSLSTLGTVASIGGTLLSAKSALDQGAYQKAAAEAENQALRDKANEDAAAGERSQITQLRRTDIALSRARAVAAGSGTSATSGDVLNTEGQIAQQGDYNALSSLYEGQSRARTDIAQGAIDLFKGNQAAAAAPLVAGGTILSGLSSALSNRAQLRFYTRTGQSPYLTGL